MLISMSISGDAHSIARRSTTSSTEGVECAYTKIEGQVVTNVVREWSVSMADCQRKCDERKECHGFNYDNNVYPAGFFDYRCHLQIISLEPQPECDNYLLEKTCNKQGGGEYLTDQSQTKAWFTRDINLLVSTRGQTQWVVSIRSIGNHHWSLCTHSSVIVTNYVEM